MAKEKKNETDSPTVETPVPEKTAPMAVVDLGAEVVATAETPTKTPEELKALLEEKPAENPAENSAPQTVAVNVTSKIPDFDPNIHRVDPGTGMPVMRSDGKGYQRKRGPAKGYKPGEVQPPAEVQAIAAGFDAPAPKQTVMMVSMMIDSFTLLAVKSFGPEWKPSNDEKSMLTDVYARYINYKWPSMNIPPEVAVISVTFAFLSPRVMTPEFQARMKGWFGGKKNAHTNSRANIERKDEHSQDHSPASGIEGNGSDSIGPA